MDKTTARFFYEQCAGTRAGDMANIPHHPDLFGLIAAITGEADRVYACSLPRFSKLLREMADAIDGTAQ